MTSQNNNNLKTQKLRGGQKKNLLKEMDQRARKRPREYGVKEASFKKMGVNQLLHRRQVR